MQFTAEQKSQLAKLMATENITVQHSKISTARFDTKNRVLQLPIWQDMTGFIYDLLCGHEVGHALYTPAEGWHDAIVSNNKGGNYKSFLNVVEDARIEKKVKRKYPGLSNSFKNAYAELYRRDFFGVKNQDINELAFIDRLNLFSKSQWTSNIDFNEIELAMVKKVQSVETWEDVLRVTDEIYEYSKDEQLQMQYLDNFSYTQDENGDYELDMDMSADDSADDSDSESNEENESTNMPGEKTKSDEKSDAKKDVKGDSDGEESDKESDTNETGNSTNHYKDSESSSFDQFNPFCKTDDAFRHNESLLLDESSKEYDYLEFPKPILKNIITPAKIVHQGLEEFYKKCVEEKSIESNLSQKLLMDFKNRNERYVGLLAKEFEMRKAAKAFSKSKLSDTGDIDINKLAGYKFDDNIFRKVMLTPKGKSHGLVLLLDKSGSMSNNMPGSIEQIMVLAMFCRKVNIPFIVYGFGDSDDVLMRDKGFDPFNCVSRSLFNVRNYPSFENLPGKVNFSNVRLREYLNSNMSNVEFNSALKNMVMVKKSFEGGRWRSELPRAPTEELSNTPLTQAIIATVDIMKEFKSKNNLDLTSLVIVHDGDADWCNRKTVMREFEKANGEKIQSMVDVGINTNNTNVFVVNRSTKWQSKLSDESRDSMNELALEYFHKMTGSKVFGFFILTGGSSGNVRYALRNRYRMPDGTDIDSLRYKDYQSYEAMNKSIMKQLKEEKFLLSNNKGFDSFFLVLGGSELVTENDEIEIEGKMTSRKLVSAFSKMNKKKAINRVLVSKFIQGIAA